MSRAVLGKLTGNDKGGASTITMQVARNFFLTREITYTRKIREIFLSFHIESLLTKDEILTLYINKIPLGHRAFGFGAAAQVYYGKELTELSLEQIAVLAGLPKAPSTYNPISRPDRAQIRRTTVLQRMLISGYITEQEYQTAKATPITGKRHGAEIELDAPYVAEMAHQEMISRYGKEQAYTGGFKVFTTVTNKLQQAAHQAVTTNLLRYDQRHGYRGAILSLRPKLDKESEINESVITGGDTNLLQELKPLTDDEISIALAKVDYYQMLVPAVVTKVNERSVNITLRDNKKASIPWVGMAWARPYINDQKQGTPPKDASDIFNYGDVVLVNQLSFDEYRLSQLPIASAAIISMSPDNGAIKAAVGGFSYKQSQFNRVTQAKRQVGSNIKPFIYSAALEKGFTLASLINDAPINQWDKSSGVVWRPKNSPETYVGPIRMRLALAQSKNVIAVRLLKSIGLDQAIGHLSSFGFAPDELPRNESLALGSASLTPLEVVTGFATFANGGFLVDPYLIERIETAEGDIIFQANPSLACDPCELSNTITEDTETNVGLEPLNDSENANTLPQTISAPRAISEQNAFLITQALNSAIWGADWSAENAWQGTGWRARTLKRRDIAGKTGTTNEGKDAWFSGFNTELQTSVWVGFDNPKTLGRREYGAKAALPIWADYMKSALHNRPPAHMKRPNGLITARINPATGKLASPEDSDAIFEIFRDENAPTQPTSIRPENQYIQEETLSPEDIF